MSKIGIKGSLSGMKEIRDLLMDCRIELRTHLRDFHKTELCKRIDDVRDELLHGVYPERQAAPTMESGDQVAVAWQLAAEDLKLTAPAIYELLAKKVSQRMANLPLVEAADVTVAVAEDAQPHAIDISADTAVVADVESDQAVIASAASLPDPDSHIPSVEALESIAASKRRFSETQREWCVGEAMVRSGFTIDPEEFIARGDNEMAKYILESAEE